MSNLRAILLVIVLGGCASMRGSDSGLDLPLPMATSPESVGVSSAKLAGIEAVTQKHIDEETVAGAVMLVARKGQIAWLKTPGYRDRPAKDPMRPDAIFRIYSMTKPIVTVAAMMQVEEGKLALDDPVSKYLPELAGMRVGTEKKDAAGKVSLEMSAPERPMTVRDLMRHTSGLVYGGPSHLVNAAYVGFTSRDEDSRAKVARLSKLPLKFSPGTRWEYSVATDVLARVVEVVDGESLGRVLERRILKPLDMRDTAFFLPPEKVGRAAQQAQKPGAKPMTVRWDVAEKPAFESGGGGLLSTTRDYLRFCLMLANGGQLEGKRILRPQTVAAMTRDQLGTVVRSPEKGFGLGVEVRKVRGDPAKSGMVGEYGWAGNAGTLFFIDPKRELIAIYMIQITDEHRVAIRNEWRDLVHGAMLD
jgi:CubicO group peptidase (beta-lactamase class C family)